MILIIKSGPELVENYKNRVFGSGRIRIGQKLINYLRFERGYKPEDMQRIIFYIEDDELQRILGVKITRNNLDQN